MGTTVQFLVTDQNGNPIQGAKVEAHSNCATFGGGMNFGGYTDGSGLTNYLDTGCNFGGQASATATADGYQSNSINFSIPECSLGALCGNINQTIALNQILTTPMNCSLTNPCPSGYGCVSGTCIKNSGTTSYSIDNFFATVKKNWLLIAVFIFIIVLVYIMIKRPDILKKTTKSISAGINKVIPK